jgi:hypothetical protein
MKILYALTFFTSQLVINQSNRIESIDRRVLLPESALAATAASGSMGIFDHCRKPSTASDRAR